MESKRTFNVPNFNDKSVWQSSSVSAGVKMLGAVPNITGNNVFGVKTNGAFKDGEASNYYAYFTGGTPNFASFDASRSSAAYGRAGDIVIPTSNNIKFCIRY